MSAQLERPLTEEELAELDTFLLSDACGAETLSIDEAHGFFTALSVRGKPIDESELLKAVWGRPDFPDEQEEARMRGLLLRMDREIRMTLDEGRPYEPLIIEENEDGEPYEIYEGWCYGFMLGVAAEPEQWESMPPEQQNLLTPMARLALLYNEDEPAMDDQEYESWAELIPGAVKGLYDFWHTPA